MNAAEPETKTKTKICRGCLQRRPLTEFRRYKKGRPQRRPRCNACRRNEDALRREQATIDELLAIGQARSRAQAAALVNDITRRLGGVEKVGALMVEHYHASEPGSFARLKFWRVFWWAMELVQPAKAKNAKSSPWGR